MRALLLTVAFFLVTLAHTRGAQEPSQPEFDQLRGVINRYLEVLEVIPCLRAVRVADTATILSLGDRVVMIQMQGARIADKDDSSFGSITDLNGAGSVEYLTVERISNDSVIFSTPWVHTYDPSGHVQLVRVSRHVDAQIAATVEPLPWNGRIGGVVAIDVDKTLALDADITATARGFRGGRVSAKKDICNNGVWTAPFASGEGGQKGEGIASNVIGLEVCAKGAAANGGGGGNGANGGGAGGAGGGNGGQGGDASSLCDPYVGSGGRAGKGMAGRVSEQRLFMGGGGGGGHQNNDQGIPGANGGGIVMVRASLIAVTTGKITSQGESVRDTSAWRNGMAMQPGDGTGGGGGGGSVMIDVQQIVGNLTVDVRGGNGGNVGARYQPNGPGGGGGGGIALLPRGHPNVSVLVAGGNPGIHVSFETGPSVFRRPWGAAGGDSGAVVTPFSWKMPTDPGLTITGADTVCEGRNVVLTASEGFASYRWSTGESGRSISVRSGGSYSVTVTDSAGCVRAPLTASVGVRSARIVVSPDVYFGTTEVGVNLRSGFVIRNVNNEPITVSGMRLPPDVRVLSPALPIILAAADSARVELEFVATRVMSLRDSLRVDVTQPCTGEAFVALQADVTADRVQFSLPQVRAEQPADSVAIPIRVRLESPTPDIRGVGLRVVIGIDARLFHFAGATSATVLGTAIDRVRQLTLIDLTFPSIDITPTSEVLTELRGISLLAPIVESPITIESVTWDRPFGGPTTRSDTGRLSVGVPCGSARRAVQFMRRSVVNIAPNPAMDHVVIEMDREFTSDLRWSIITIHGEAITGGYLTSSPSGRHIIPTMELASGMYILHLAADEGTISLPLLIRR